MTLDWMNRRPLAALATRSPAPPTVSIYVPTETGPEGAEVTRVLLAHLAAKAAKELRELGAPTDALTLALRPYTEQEHAWPAKVQGLAVFCDDAGLEIYALPRQVDALCVVGSCVHLRPLLALWQNAGGFFVLALSHDTVRLLEGDRYRVERIRLDDLPKRTTENAGSDRDLVREIAPRIDARLAPIGTPLVLACVEPLHPLYEAVSGYSNLVATALTGNFDDVGDEELRAAAWELLEPTFTRDADERVRRFGEPGRTVAGIPDVLAAAVQGRIETLYVRVGVWAWGHVEQDGGFEQLEHRGAGCDDLLDRAAVATYASGGEVLQLPEDRMPGPEPICATLSDDH